MATIESIIRSINRELVPQFEERLRQYLAEQDKEWLIEQIVRLSLDAHSLEARDRKIFQEQKEQQRSERIDRVRDLSLDRDKLTAFTSRYAGYDRDRLIDEGYLVDDPPARGTDLIPPRFRSPKGEELLLQAKDILFALLFGDETTNTRLERVQQELLTMTLPRFKAEPLDFMKATTEMQAEGTWQDPDSVSNDARADNVILQVEFGENPTEDVGHGIVRALTLINLLEINEQILYARMENVEESTLIG